MALTEQQLAALDLLIYAKKANIVQPGFININHIADNVAHVANAVAAVGGAVAVTAAVVAGAIEYRDDRLRPGGKGLSVEELMIIRKQAIERS